MDASSARAAAACTGRRGNSRKARSFAADGTGGSRGFTGDSGITSDSLRARAIRDAMSNLPAGAELGGPDHTPDTSTYAWIFSGELRTHSMKPHRHSPLTLPARTPMQHTQPSHTTATLP